MGLSALIALISIIALISFGLMISGGIDNHMGLSALIALISIIALISYGLMISGGIDNHMGLSSPITLTWEWPPNSPQTDTSHLRMPPLAPVARRCCSLHQETRSLRWGACGLQGTVPPAAAAAVRGAIFPSLSGHPHALQVTPVCTWPST